MAIQMRRGLKADFDPTRMLPGEWAVSIDTDSSKQVIWMCFGPGVVKRMGTYEDFSAQIQSIISEIDEHYMDLFEEMKDEIEEFYNGAKGYAESAETDAQSAKSSKESASASATSASESATSASASATNAATSATNANTYATNAENSKNEAYSYVQTVVNAKDVAVAKASEASVSEINAQTYASNASASEENALRYKNSANTSATNAESYAEDAESSKDIATTKANEALDSANTAQSYAVGGTGTRDGENTDNSKYYSEQSENAAQRAESIAQSMGNIIVPKGTVAFEDLPPLRTAKVGWMYNISNDFVTTDDFEEGAGISMPLGTNVYKTDNNKWDAFSGNPVTGVKGSNETEYRRGNINITKANIGLGSVDNTSDADKPISTATQSALDQKPDYDDIPDVPSWAMEDEKPSYTKAEVGLGNVDNTSDANKPVSDATRTALSEKVGKTEYATNSSVGVVKPDGTTTTVDADGTLHATALPQEQADWQQTDSTKVDYIKNKPTIPHGDNETITEDADGTLHATADTTVPNVTYAEYMANLDDYENTLVNVTDVSDGGFTIDSELSTTSENAIQNKAVANALVPLNNQILNLGDFSASYSNLDDVLVYIFNNLIPHGGSSATFSRGQFIFNGRYTFEALAYPALNYGYLKVKSFYGMENELNLYDGHCYFTHHDNSNITQHISTLSSHIDTYAGDTMLVTVHDSRIREGDSISTINIWDVCGRGVPTYTSATATIIYDGCAMIEVANCSHRDAGYILRIQFDLTRRHN